MKKNRYRTAAAVLAVIMAASSMSAVSYASEPVPVAEEAAALSQEAEDPREQGSTGQNAMEGTTSPADTADTGAAGGEETGTQDNTETPGGEQTPGTQEESGIPAQPGEGATGSETGDVPEPEGKTPAPEDEATDSVIPEEETVPEELLIEEETEVVTEEALAANAVASGTCSAEGSSLTWEITGESSTGYTLTIDGSGKMADYEVCFAIADNISYTIRHTQSAPWKNYRNQIKSVVIGKDVRHIGAGAFQHFTALTSVTFESETYSYLTLGDGCFAYCDALRELHLPKHIREAGDGVLFGTNLTKLTTEKHDGVSGLVAENNVLYYQSVGNGSVIGGSVKYYSPSLKAKSFRLPSWVGGIGTGLFANHPYLKEVVLPGSLRTIERFAFYGLPFSTINFSDTKLERIESSAFRDCKNLRSIRLPDSMKIVESFAFAGCSALTEVSLNAHTFVREDVFNDCSSLTSYTVPAGGLYMAQIPSGCTSLKTLILSEGSTHFGHLDEPIWNIRLLQERLPALEEVYLPASLKALYYVFSAETTVKKIYYAGTEAMWERVEKIGNEGLANIPIEFAGDDIAYVITFDAAGGEGETAPVRGCVDEEVVLPACGFTKHRYAFAGWMDEKHYKDGDWYLENYRYLLQPGETVVNTGTTTFYACWKVNEFNVRYDGNGATYGYIPQERFSGYNNWDLSTRHFDNIYYTGASRFFRDGFKQTGWEVWMDGAWIKATTTDDLIDRVAFGDTLTLRAVWEAEAYPIHYTTGSHFMWIDYTDREAPHSYQPASEDFRPITLPVPESKKWVRGYEFAGWYLDAAFKKKIEVITEDMRGALHLYAKAVPSTYTIVFDKGEGEEAGAVSGKMKDITRTCNTPFAALPACAYKRPGYVFAGWTIDPDKLVPLFSSYDAVSYVEQIEEAALKEKIDGKHVVTLYAVWEQEGTVVFDVNAGDATFQEVSLVKIQDYITNGSAADKQITLRLPQGGKIASGAMPKVARPGYTFTGWYRDATLKKKVSSVSMGQADGRFELYAGWRAHAFTVKYTKGVAKSGVTGSNTAVKLNADNRIITLPECLMKKPGCTFTGWIVPLGTQLADGTNLPEGSVVKPGEEVELPVPEKNNQTMQIDAQWHAEQYEIKFLCAGGELVFTDAVIKALGLKETYHAGDGTEYTGTYNTLDETLKGFRFPKVKLWKESDCAWMKLSFRQFERYRDDTGQWVKCSSLPVASTTGNLSINAAMKVGYKQSIRYAVSADPETNTSYSVTKVTFGDVMKLRTTPVKALKGYALAGWATREQIKHGLEEYFEPGDPVMWRTPDDVTLYPVFQDAFTVILHAGNNAYFDDYKRTIEVSFRYGEGIDKNTMKTLQPENHLKNATFDGWQYTDYNGKVKKITGAIPKTLNRSLELTAVWKYASTKIIFHNGLRADDPLNNQIKGKMTAQTWSWTKTQRLKKCGFSIKGYRFKGWADSQAHADLGTLAYVYNDLEPEAEMINRGQYIFSASNPRDPVLQPELHLYAIWEKESYAITYAGENGRGYWEGGAVNWPVHLEDNRRIPRYYSVDTPAFTFPEPMRDGYVFQGWYKDPKFRTRITQVKKGSTGDLTLYAKWKKL